MNKGLELPVSTIIITTIVVLVLVVIGFFFFSQSSTSISSAEARRIFTQGCVNIKCDTTKNFCESIVDIAAASTKFWRDFGVACEVLYGFDDNKLVQCMRQCPECSGISDADITKVDTAIRNSRLNPMNACSSV